MSVTMNNLQYLVESELNQFLSEREFDVYHGTNSDKFDSFKYSKIGTGTNSFWNGVGFYFSDNKAEASLYGNNLIKAKITLNNPIDLTQIHDTSVQGSGIVRLFAGIKGFDSIQYEGHTYEELNNILNQVENEFDFNKIQFSDGNNESFKHVWYVDGDNEYVLRNRTASEYQNKNFLKASMIHTILYEKYGIGGLPIRISEAVSPHVFTEIAKNNGYDGVIAPNSTVASGNEYVVFDKNNIKIENQDNIKQLVETEFQNYLNENPDTVVTSNSFHELDYTDLDTITFGYLNNEMYVSFKSDEAKSVGRSTHFNTPRFYKALSNSPNYPIDNSKYKTILDYIKSEDDSGVETKDFQYPGRIWAGRNTISLWNYPPNSANLFKIIADVKKELAFIGTIIPVPSIFQNFYIKYVDIPAVHVVAYDSSERQRYSDWYGPYYKSVTIDIGAYDLYEAI